MPEIGKLSTWLIENGGTMATWIIVSAIVLFTIWVKKDEWFGKRATTAPKPTEKPAEPEPKKAPEPEPAKDVKAESVTTPKKGENTGRTVMHGIYSMWRPARNAIIFCAVCFGFWIGVIRIVQEAEHYKQGHDLVRVIDSTRSTAPGERSAFFNGQTHFLQEVIKFWNHDPEIVASSTRRERWEGIDTVRFESRYQQYNPDGSVFRGVQNPRDIGMFQINLDQSAKEIAEANCNVEAVDCQFKVARLIWKHSKFKRWLAHNDVLKAPVVVHKVVAPVGEWGEIFIPPFDDSCFWEVDRKVEMMGEDGQVYEFLPDNVPFFATRTTTYRVPDEPAGLVTISCRQHK